MTYLAQWTIGAAVSVTVLVVAYTQCVLPALASVSAILK